MVEIKKLLSNSTEAIHNYYMSGCFLGCCNFVLGLLAWKCSYQIEQTIFIKLLYPKLFSLTIKKCITFTLHRKINRFNSSPRNKNAEHNHRNNIYQLKQSVIIYRGQTNAPSYLLPCQCPALHISVKSKKT